MGEGGGGGGEMKFLQGGEHAGTCTRKCPLKARVDITQSEEFDYFELVAAIFSHLQ